MPVEQEPDPTLTSEIATQPPREEAFRLLVEAVQDYAIFLLGPDGRVRTWNPGAERAKGYKASEIIGQHFSVFYTPEEREAGRPQGLLARAASEGSSIVPSTPPNASARRVFTRTFSFFGL